MPEPKYVPRVKTLYLVQIIRTGLMGPIKVKLDEGLNSYWSEDGNIEYDENRDDYHIDQVVFLKEKNAKLFVQGASWYMKNLKDTLTNNLNYLEE